MAKTKTAPKDGAKSTRAPTDRGGSAEPLPDENKAGAPSALQFQILHIVGKAADRFGIPFGLLVFILFAVKLLAKEETQDLVIREIFFAGVTGKPYVSIFIGMLVVLSIPFSEIIRRRLSEEKREMKRLADEKSRLQEQALGVPLNHTKGPKIRVEVHHETDGANDAKKADGANGSDGADLAKEHAAEEEALAALPKGGTAATLTPKRGKGR